MSAIFGQPAEACTRVHRFPPRGDLEVVRDDLGGDVAAAAGYRAAWVGGRARHVQAVDRGAVAEAVPHRLVTGEGADEDVAADHVDQLLCIVVGGPDVPGQDVVRGDVGCPLAPGRQHPVGELLFHRLDVLRVAAGGVRHRVPAVGGGHARRGLGRVELGDRAGAEAHPGRDLVAGDLIVQGEQLLDRLAADVDLERGIDVRVEVGADVPGRLLQREVQAEQRPGGLPEVADLFPVRLGQLLLADHGAEGLRDVDGAGHEPGADLSAVGKLDASGLVAVDDDPGDVGAGLQLAAGGDERVHEPVGHGDAAALGDLVVRHQVEASYQGAHRAAGGELVVQDGAEQGDLEQQQEAHVFVLEQFLDRRERLAVDDLQEVAAYFAFA